MRTVGWTNTLEPGFGGARDDASIKARLINLVSSVRTLMRSTFVPAIPPLYCYGIPPPPRDLRPELLTEGL